MQAFKIIFLSIIACIISAFAPSLFMALEPYISKDYLFGVYTYFSEIQFVVFYLFLFFLLLSIRWDRKWCKWGLGISFVLFLCILILSIKGAQLQKSEICIYTTLTIFLGFLVKNQIFNSESYIPHAPTAPPEQLGRTRFYNSGVRLIRENARLENAGIEQKKAAYALISPWGNGKTHFLQYIIAHLSCKKETESPKEYNGKFRICSVSLWESKTPEEAWVNIINALHSSVTNTRNKSHIAALPGFVFSNLMRIGGIFSSSLNNLNSVIEIVSDAGKYDIESKAAVIDEKLGDERALLIFDDVDRAPFEIIKALLPLIERLKKISKLSIICAMDVEEVEKMYKHTQNIDSETLHGYLFKVFDYNFHLPQLSYEMMEEKMRISARTLYPECRFLNLFIDEIKLFYDTPRQMERMLNEWANIERNFLPSSTFDKIDERTKKEAFIIFIAKAMTICAPAITKKLINEEKPWEDMVSMFSLNYHDYSVQDILKKDDNIHNPMLFASCLNFFSDYKNFMPSLKNAVEQKYARRVDITDFECEDLINRNFSSEPKTTGVLLDEYFQNEPLEPHSKVPTAYKLFDFAVKKLIESPAHTDKETYYNFLLKIVRAEKTSNGISKNENYDSFNLSHEAFDECIFLVLEDKNKYQELLDLLFDKLSYHNQGIACLRLHLVYDSDAPEYCARSTTPASHKLMYNKRNSEDYKTIIKTYIQKYTSRYCELLLSPCNSDFASEYALYLYMQPKLFSSLDIFNVEIIKWIESHPKQKIQLFCGFMRHLLTPIKPENAVFIDNPLAYIPEGISQKLPSIFNMFDNIDVFTTEEKEEIKQTIQQVLPKIQHELNPPIVDFPTTKNPFIKGANEVIEKMQSCLNLLSQDNIKTK